MTRRITFLFSLALLLVLTSLVSSDSTSAQTQMYVADTGIITIQPGQTLRLTVAGADSETATVYFRKRFYVDAGASGGVMRRQVSSVAVSGSLTIAPDQAAAHTEYHLKLEQVRGEVVSTSRNIKVSAFVVDPAPSGGTGSNGSSILPTQQISFNFSN